MRHLLAAAAILALATPLAAQESDGMTTQATQATDLSLERVFASPGLNGPSPRGAKLSPDGRYLTLLRNREDDKDRYDLWGYDRETGEWTMLVDSEKLSSGRELSEDEKMQRERARVGNLKGIISYQWSPDSTGVLVPLDGDLYLAKLDGTITRLTDTEESELNPKLSEQGTYVSFVRDRQLWVGEVGKEAQPITPKEGDLIRWGEAEFVAQEEMGRMDGYWWSPDDKRIAVQRTDEAPVGVVTRAAIGATGTKVFDQRYPAAGSDNAFVELFVMDPDGGNMVKVDLGQNPDIYLARVDWSPDGDWLFAQRENRDQTMLELLSIDPATGRSDVILTEKAAIEDYWINLSDDYRFLKDHTMIWWSESDGYGHLYRRTREGQVQLTQGDWVVTKLVGVNEESGDVFFTGTRDGALEQHVYRMNLSSPGEATRLTELGFTHSASMDKDAQTLLISRSSPSQPPQSYLADTDGNRLTWVQENALDADHPYAPFLDSHVTPEFGTILTDDGTPLHWMMLKPDMEPGKKYPVFFYHYGGPHVQVVDHGWKGALPQAIVDKAWGMGAGASARDFASLLRS